MDRTVSWTEDDYKTLMRDRGQTAFKEAEKAAPKSKYRNVRVAIDGEKFDSKREASIWSELKLREKAKEIGGLRRQVPFDLMAPQYDIHTDTSQNVVVAQYVCDFIFDDYVQKKRRILDVKGGKETAMFALKRKWLFLQSGIEIEVVR